MFDPLDMLRRLAPAVRPVVRRKPRSTLDGSGFDELLTRLAEGDLRTDAPLRNPEHEPEAFDKSQLQRLGDACDRAIAAGFGKPLILFDGRSMVVDASTRVIEHELRDSDGAQIVDVDGVVFVPSDCAASAPGGTRMPLLCAAIPARFHAHVLAKQDAQREMPGVELERIQDSTP